MTWCDLRELEHHNNERWLTHVSDDNRWLEFAKANGLPLPRMSPTHETPENEEIRPPTTSPTSSLQETVHNNNNGKSGDHSANHASGRVSKTPSPLESSPTPPSCNSSAGNNPFCTPMDSSNTNPFFKLA